jgi:hypothetical protein
VTIKFSKNKPFLCDNKRKFIVFENLDCNLQIAYLSYSIRLKHTFHGSRIDTVTDLEELFNPKSSFKNYREHFQNEELLNIPVVPYIGIVDYLTNLLLL